MSVKRKKIAEPEPESEDLSGWRQLAFPGILKPSRNIIRKKGTFTPKRDKSSSSSGM